MKILIIDDEESLLKLLRIGLSDLPAKISTASTGQEGIDFSQKELFDIVLCDIGLPDKSGLQVLDEIRKLQPELPVVMITAHGSVETALQAMKRGAYDYIQKPFEVDEMKIVIQRALRERQLMAEYSRLKQEVSHQYDFSSIVGASTAMKNLFQRMRKAAETKSTVLILGESGTGKELLAKAIHYNSARKDAPFVVVDCGAIPANLLESELFGHMKGAFTGADRPKKGLFEEAHRGSIFLDEIGELPIELQAKLLRVLQESTIRKVGDTQSQEIDVRVIAATNRNLENEVKEGRFRQDLFYRLNVVPLQAPSLRERKEDIPLLATHFLKKYAKEFHRPLTAIEPPVMQKLMSFDWPGNVRQLENLIEQMVVMAEGSTLTLEGLPPPLNSVAGVEPAQIPVDSWDLKAALDNVQRYTEECMIRRALEHTRNNKTKAAELLGISRRALIYKVQEYKIEKINLGEEAL